ncbi:MAG TPA: CopD family protein [Arenimonas sp.]|uniref:CopD family protein n=1 Tax=Arenimonas sp. TaxID=1872635 RepID=UPI002B6932AD|nr:CopD family protein [Arenimonas sp.]HMB55669.1 CopD family protein [Arenimonas sp.]
MAYLWTKTFHLLFVMAWMATVFYLPRILVNIAEAGDAPAVRDRLVLMGRRLYRFGHMMFGFAVAFGALLFIGHYFSADLWPDVVAGRAWMHAKLGLVALLLIYFIACGRMLKRAASGGALPASTTLRWLNELPLLLLVGVIYLVLAKPF